MDGILNINKPAGPTSHDVVAQVRRTLGIRRVGHAGTLDPLATGVLVVCVGRATRIVEYLVAQEKEYRADLFLGSATTTEDVSGEVISTSDASHITREMVQEVLPRFTGLIMQTPPMVSAVKHQGQRLYKLARKDIEVERQPREVTVYELEMTSFSQAGPEGAPTVGLRVVCSSGTYIRTICADIGAALGVGGYMRSLIRTRVGRFVIENAVDLDSLQRAAADRNARELILPMDEALPEMPQVAADPAQSALIVHGGAIESDSSLSEGTLVRVKSFEGRLLAIGKAHRQAAGSIITPVKVLAEAER